MLKVSGITDLFMDGNVLHNEGLTKFTHPWSNGMLNTNIFIDVSKLYINVKIGEHM